MIIEDSHRRKQKYIFIFSRSQQEENKQPVYTVHGDT